VVHVRYEVQERSQSPCVDEFHMDPIGPMVVSL
jgi:hypothetical protein